MTKDIGEVLNKGGKALLIRILGYITGYLFIYYTVEYFGAETQGRLNLCFSFMMVGALLSRMGLDIHFVKIFSIDNNESNAKGIYFKTLPVVFAISTTIAIALYLLSDYISKVFFKDPALSIYLKWTSPTIVLFSIMLINASVFRGLKKNSLYSFLFNGGRFLFTLLFFLLLTSIFNDATTTVMAHTLGVFVLFLISVIYILKFNHPFHSRSKYKTRSFIKKSLPMLVSTSMIIFLGWSDTLILGIYNQSSDVGIYGVTLKIAVITSFTFQALDSILAPKLSFAYHSGDDLGFKKLIKYSTFINTVISVFAVFLIITFRDLILSIFGPEFIKGSTALIILCLGQLFNAICGPVGSVLQMTGKQLIFQNILIISFVTNIVLNLILTPLYGITGVAVSTAFSLALWNSMGLIYMIRKIY